MRKVSCRGYVGCLLRKSRPSWLARERASSLARHALAGLASRFLASLESLLNCYDRQSTITSLAWQRLRIFEPKRRRCRARPLGNGKRVGPPDAANRDFIFILFSRARSCGGALLMACARLGVVCAVGCCVQLDAVCARRGVCALLSFFFQRYTDVVFLRPANLARRCYGSSDDEGG